MRTRGATALLLLGLVTACGQDEAEAPAAPERTPSASAPATSATAPTPPPPPTASAPTPASAGTTLVADDSHVGRILFDSTGQAVYVFDVETTDEPRCYGECAEAWPPVVTEGAPRADQGVRRGLLGTTTRRDGSTQVTYDGRPLYYYAHEGKHEVECHDVFLNGGTWYAVQPDGQTPP
jgi:predicted lipoprotein with Yx(FWY)xxD motif